jgi:hypothetical protein
VVQYLIEAGADVNACRPKFGSPVLMAVAQTCSLQMAEILVEAGADPTIPGSMGVTALDKSKQRKRFEGPQVHASLCETAKRLHPKWPRLRGFIGTRGPVVKQPKRKK